MSLPRIIESGDISALLDIMLTKSRMTELRSIINGAQGHRKEENLWYISDHVAHHLRRSTLYLTPRSRFRVNRPDSRPPVEADYSLMRTGLSSRPLVLANGHTLDNNSREIIRFYTNGIVPPPNEVLIDFFQRISNLAYWVGMEEDKRRGVYQSRFDGLIPVPVRFYRWLFRLLSPSIRVRIYSLLVRWGRRLYGAADMYSGLAQRVPFGLYIKQGRKLTTLQNEENALKLVEKQTRIPAPRHIDTLMLGERCFMIISRVPGKPLSKVYEALTMDELERLRGDIADAIQQLRAIKNPHRAVICNTLGGPLRDRFFPHGECKPLDSEDESDTFQQHGLHEDWKKEWNVFPPHEIFLTHTDLHVDNLMILNGRLSGIIDWELWGWLPAYWEYVKFYHLTNLRHFAAPKVFSKMGEDWARERRRQYHIWSSAGLWGGPID